MGELGVHISSFCINCYFSSKSFSFSNQEFTVQMFYRAFMLMDCCFSYSRDLGKKCHTVRYRRQRVSMKLPF